MASDLPVAFDGQQLMRRTVNRHSTQEDMANEQWQSYIGSYFDTIVILLQSVTTEMYVRKAINEVFSQLNTSTIVYLMCITTPGRSHEILLRL